VRVQRFKTERRTKGLWLGNLRTEGSGGGDVKERLTISKVAGEIGVTAKTLARWEKTGKISRPKRDWRGWRVYTQDDLNSIKLFHETLFEAE